MEQLKCNIRNKNAAHSAKKSRRRGMVPGIIYGKGMQNLLFEIAEMDLTKELSENGEHGLININIDGEKHKALIKEIQKDPVNHKLVHIDLEDLAGSKTITTEIPILFIGENEAGRNGGILQKERTKVKIQCRAEEVPKNINIDVSLLSIGRSCRIRDLEVSNEISILDDPNCVIATVGSYNTNDIEAINSEKIVSDAEITEKK